MGGGSYTRGGDSATDNTVFDNDATPWVVRVTELVNTEFSGRIVIQKSCGATVDPAQNPHQNIIPTTTLYEFKFFNQG